MKDSDLGVEKVEVEKGNTNGYVIVKGNYYQVHGDFINEKNESDPLPNRAIKRKTILFEVEGCLDDIDPIQLKNLLKALRQVSRDGSVMMRDIEKGSIKISLEGSEEGILRILKVLQVNELQEVAGFPTIKIQELNETEKAVLKSKLIRSIRNQNQRITQLAWTNLSAADLSAADLSRADLSAADLSAANLSRADLSRADLSLANLSKADLSWVNLNGTNLSGTNLSGTILSWADLSGAILSGANLSGAILLLAKLRGTDLRRTDLSRANLKGADLREANLSGADLSGADLEGTIFSHNNKGLSEEIKRDFIERGAIFQDSPGSGDRVLIRS